MSKDKNPPAGGEIKKKTEEKVDKKDKAEEYLNNWKRAVADLENYKKDQAKMLGEFRKFATLDVILQIIPVLDNFNASLEHVPEDQKDNSWVTGIIYIKKQLEDVLKNNGVEEIEVREGDEFDPGLHEAIDTKETNIDTKETNKIMKVAQKGYKIDGKIIRAVRVIVE
ncbi:MAG: nucleotide exchange factor GrpE [Parcubacteria group bacterium]